MNKKKTFYLLSFIFIILIFLILKPINTSKENSMKLSGKVESISEGGVKDMVFKLEGEKKLYYINRGFENGFELNKSRKNLIGKNVELYYSKHWTPLAPSGLSSFHITHLSCENKVVYSEWK